jgi:hypothetical protein
MIGADRRFVDGGFRCSSGAFSVIMPARTLRSGEGLTSVPMQASISA